MGDLVVEVAEEGSRVAMEAMAMVKGMVAMEVTGMDKATVMVMMVDMEDMGNSGEAGVTEAMTRIMDMATITTTITTELWMMDDQLTNDQGEYFCKVFLQICGFLT